MTGYEFIPHVVLPFVLIGLGLYILSDARVLFR